MEITAESTLNSRSAGCTASSTGQTLAVGSEIETGQAYNRRLHSLLADSLPVHVGACRTNAGLQLRVVSCAEHTDAADAVDEILASRARCLQAESCLGIAHVSGSTDACSVGNNLSNLTVVAVSVGVHELVSSALTCADSVDFALTAGTGAGAVDPGAAAGTGDAVAVQ